MNFTRYLLSIAAGLAAHQTNPIFEELEARHIVGAAWYRMARYGVGTLFMLPTFLILLPAEIRRRVADSFLSNATLFGFGVALGYVIEWIREKSK